MATKKAPVDPAAHTAKKSKKAVGVRARVRAELTAEIKAAAGRQMAASGASSLSLRAISRELGMASSAIYRYFASRDELLTALIIDAYTDLADTIDAAVDAVSPDDHPARFTALALSLRGWAVAKPNEYALIYGSPVPGYAAPEDTVPAAARIPRSLLELLVEGHQTNKALPDNDLSRSLAGLIEYTDGTIDTEALKRGVEVWAELFGLISLELFGHFTNTVTDPELFFEQAVSAMADRVLTPS